MTLVLVCTGYQQANDKEEEIMEMIDREADGSDSLEASVVNSLDVMSLSTRELGY